MPDQKRRELEKRFHSEMINIFYNARDECDYPAKRFLKMVGEKGGYNAAKDLIHAEGYSDGLIALCNCDCLRLSVEALVLRNPWKDLFSTEDLNAARKKLEDLGYSLESESDQ